MTAVEPGRYPPDPHVLRDLCFTSERQGARTLVHADATPLLSDGDDHLSFGVLAILLDVSGAATAIEAVRPDWIATVDLTYHGAPVPHGPVVIDVAPVRLGRNLVVMGARVGGRPDPDDVWGRGLITFTRIPGSATEAVLDDRRNGETTTLLPATPLDQPIERRLGLREVDPAAGVLELPHTDYARNSFGTINGGVVGLLCETAARRFARHHVAPTVTTHGLEVHYLAQAEVGPARTHATLVRGDDRAATVQVEVADEGTGTRLAIAMVSLATT